MVVWQYLPTEQYVSKVAFQVFAPPEDTVLCQNHLVPSAGDMPYFHSLWGAVLQRMGKLGCYGHNFLANTFYNHNHRSYTVFHLCPDDMVQFLPHWLNRRMGVAKERAFAGEFHTR